MRPKNKIINILLVLTGVIITGIAGYMIIEKWTFIDSAYMTVITLSSVGFSEVQPLSTAGKVFTIFLILGGLGALFYGISLITEFIAEGGLHELLRRRKMNKLISQLDNHYIICGASDTGRSTIDEFIKTKSNFIVVEPDIEQIKKIDDSGNLPYYMEDDPTKDDTLLKAGIKKAKGLISVLPTDKDNLFVVLSARELNPRLRIVAQAIEEDSKPKLLKAGADSVILPNVIGGLRMASEVLRPAVVTFLDLMIRGKEMTLRVEEAMISSSSSFIGKTLGEAEVPRKTGLIVVAIKDGEDKGYHYNPGASTILKENDILIVMGNVEQTRKLKELIKK